MTAVLPAPADEQAASPYQPSLTGWGVRAVLIVAFVLAVVILPTGIGLGDEDWAGRFSDAAIYSVIGLSLNVILGYTGQLSLGHQGFVGAGAVVLRDVPARAVVVGNPARRIRDVPDDELLG